MRIWRKIAAVAVMPLMLAGCLWGPGKFTSNLALNKSGTFVLDYRGEIVLQMPDKDIPPTPWNDGMARCTQDGEAKLVNPLESLVLDDAQSEENEDADEAEGSRPCTEAEIAKLKAQYASESAAKAASKKQENEQMAKMFGLPGTDDASNRRFAANLMKYAGWRSVSYRGKGVFDVDYHFEGRLTQDYAFPMMPDSDMMIPFIILKRRVDGSVMMTAPALTGGAGPFTARAKAMGLPDKGNDGPASQAEGRFTVTTDGEILTNNSEDGPVAGPAGRQVHWDVGPGSAKVPEMLIKL
jgi:hypothetical protein